MVKRIILGASTLLLLACSIGDTQVSVNATPQMIQKIPEPDSWKFPNVMDAAREVVSLSIEGEPFNRYGLAYSLDELKQLDIRSLTAVELQNYADVVTHAYPDALGRQIADDCDSTDIDELSNRSIASVAYVSLNAIDAGIRDKAAACLAIIHARL